MTEIGRPSSFTQEVADKICQRIADGESLRAICRDEGMPSHSSVFRWLGDEQRADFREQYARAREVQAETIFEEILEIADDGRRDYVPDEDGREVVDHDHIQRAKLRVDARKWMLGKMAPKKYGERLQLANDPEDPIGQLTDEQLEAKLAALMGKANGDG